MRPQTAHTPPPRGLGSRLLWLTGLIVTFLLATGAAAFIADRLGLAPLAAALVGQVVILTVVILFSLLDGDGFRSLGVTGRWKWYDVPVIPGIIVLHFFGSVISAVILQMMQEGLSGEGIISVLQEFGSQEPLAFVGYALSLALLAGVGEELLFRGYLITRLERMGLPGWACILISALAFGLAHWTGYGLIASLSKAVWFGIPTGIYFWYRRNLGPIMVAHALMDLMGFILVYVVSQFAPLVPAM